MTAKQLLKSLKSRIYQQKLCIYRKTGNINRASRLLSENKDNGVLNLTAEVRPRLKVISGSQSNVPPTSFKRSSEWITRGRSWGYHQRVYSESINKNERSNRSIRIWCWCLVKNYWIKGIWSLGVQKSFARMTKKLLPPTAAKL